MEKDTIITLDNNVEYILLDEVEENNKKYFLAVQYSSKDNKTSNNYKLFEEINDNNEFYLEEVSDEKIKQVLLALFTVNYSELVDEIIKEEGGE